MGTPALLLDVDGTLVDSNYQLVVAWLRAFAAHDVPVSAATLHRHMGMGGDKLVAAVAGDDVERAIGASVRDRWADEYGALMYEVRPVPGVRAFLRAAEQAGARLLLCSSSPPKQLEHYRSVAGLEGIAAVSAEDAKETKPHPDLIDTALERTGRPVVMVGDTPWDCIAAGKADVPIVGLLAGGFSPEQLRGEGACAIYDDLNALASALDEVLAFAR
jgi:phosphoglycolate phosphatase-like HAD superfamily hydrolase